LRVLLVEDEIRLASYVRKGLEQEGYAVDIASDGEQGVWMASNQAYDVIVLDIMLPKLNGYRVCAELRSRQVWTPVLMLTAKDGELDEAEALDTGADDFLRKPFSFAVLLARLRALVRRPASERPATLKQGDVTLDPASHIVTVAGVEVELTPTEFSLLELFLRRPGQVLSKAAILESCWDWAFEGDPNIVEVYVGHLRRKIDPPSGPSRLTTIRGAGYRFDVSTIE
jgi:DNA-binding response OmpR family regulator